MNLFIALLSLALPLSVVAWGSTGHRSIAEVAVSMLDAADQATVKYLAHPEMLDVESRKRMHRDQTIVDLSVWPDEFDHTDEGRWSAPLHYVDLSLSDKAFNMTECDEHPPGCVVDAITNYTARFLAEGPKGKPCPWMPLSERDKVQPTPCDLSFVTHFVGDVHQPLHVGYGFDLGGNKLHVELKGEPNTKNLHSAWDSGIIYRWVGNNNERELEKRLSAFIDANPKWVKNWTEANTVVDWADESFTYVRENVYQFTKGGSKAPPPNDPSRPPIKLSDWYVTNAIPIIEQRLSGASVRLYLLIKKILGEWKQGEHYLNLMSSVKAVEEQMAALNK